MSTALIFKKIPQIMKAVGAIGKHGKNDAQGFSFRGIEDCYNAFHSVLAAHGVFCAPEVFEVNSFDIQKPDGKVSYRTVIRVCHRFYAEDGSCVEVTTVGEGLDSSDKSANKAMSAAMKYAFIELFSIPTRDVEDSDRESPEAGKSSQPAPQVHSVTRVQTRSQPVVHQGPAPERSPRRTLSNPPVRPRPAGGA